MKTSEAFRKEVQVEPTEEELREIDVADQDLLREVALAVEQDLDLTPDQLLRYKRMLAWKRKYNRPMACVPVVDIPAMERRIGNQKTQNLKRTRPVSSPSGVTPTTKRVHPNTPVPPRPTQSYASAAAPVAPSGSKTKRDRVEYLLYIHRGKEDRLALAEDDWKYLMAAVEEALVLSCMPSTSHSKPEPIHLQTEWTSYRNGMGLIACNDEYTADWYRWFIGNTFKGSQCFKAWRAGELGRRQTCTLVVRERLARFTGEQILNLLLVGQRPPITGEAKFLEKTKSQSSSDVIYKFAIDDNIADEYRKRNWKVYLPTHATTLRYQDEAGLRARLGISSTDRPPARVDEPTVHEEEVQVVDPTETNTMEVTTAEESAVASGSGLDASLAALTTSETAKETAKAPELNTTINVEESTSGDDGDKDSEGQWIKRKPKRSPRYSKGSSSDTPRGSKP